MTKKLSAQLETPRLSACTTEFSCAVDQAKIIVDLVHRNGRVWILTDGDKAGERCAHNLLEEVGSKRFCTWLRLSEGQPTDCSPEELGAMLEWKIKV